MLATYDKIIARPGC